MKRVAGFTLIELMIVTAIIGVLSVVSFPAMKTYQERSHRTSDCKVPLVELDYAMKRYHTLNHVYPTDLSLVSFDLVPNGGDYTLSLDNTSTTREYTLVCTNADKDVDINCAPLSYDNYGRKGARHGATTAATDKEIERCWR